MRTEHRRLRFMLIPLSAVFVAVSFCAGADIITFSGEASDSDAPLSYFVATIDYTYNPGTGLLFLTVTNQTAAPAGYTLSELFLNVSDNVTGLNLIGNGGFTGASFLPDGHAGGFGTFDYELDLGEGNAGLAPGASATFILHAGGVNLSLEDFFTGLSYQGGLTPAIAALKFTQGPDDDSVYTIPGDSPVLPEPGTWAILGIGTALLAAKRRRFGARG